MLETDRNATDVWAKRKQQAMALLGGTMLKMPVRFWDANMLFKGVENAWWRLKTGGFPATNHSSGSHPLFVLAKIGNQGFRICPCSSKGGSSRYIRKGCALMQTNEVVDRNSYLVERFSCTLPASAAFSAQPRLSGIVPDACIRGERP